MMQDSEMCPKCKSTEVIPDVRVADHRQGGRSSNLCVELDENPDAMIFKGTKERALRAWVCGSCGYTELYTEGPEEFWEIHQQRQRS